MFGLSFQKIVVFIAIIAAIIAAMRLIRSFERSRDARVRGQAQSGTKTREASVAESMKECPVCRTYVLASAARDCGKARCPYPS